MAQTVIKRDGSKEPFDESKLRRSIEVAVREAGLEKDRVSEVTTQIADAALELAASKDEIPSSELRKKILSDLDTVEPSVAKAWRQYDEARGRA